MSKGIPAGSQVAQPLVKVADFLLLIEPLWVLLAAAMIYFSVVFAFPAYFPWMWITIALLPFPLRLLRWGYLSSLFHKLCYV